MGPSVQTDVFPGQPASVPVAAAPAVPVRTGSFTSAGAAEYTRTAQRPSVSVGGWGGDVASAPEPPIHVKGTVHKSGFGDSVVAAPPVARPRPVAEAPASGVEILFKPKPSYTDEARRKRIEGAVVLEVLFSRTGEVKVRSVVQGLGYGLDESAIDAAQRIRFKPAQRNGQPVDSTANIHITFQIAY